MSKFLFYLALSALILTTGCLTTGCTIRGGWPRFLRKGEASGWNGPKAEKETPATGSQLTKGQ